MIDGLNEIADDNSKILILGTFPSTTTLKECKRLNRHDDYYLDFSYNKFWVTLGKIFHSDKSNICDISEKGYNCRKNLLLENGIALWDIIKSCEKRNDDSNDTSIIMKTAEPNNIIEFIEKHRNLKAVYFNGKGIYDYWCHEFNSNINRIRISGKLSWYEKFKPWELNEKFGKNIEFKALQSTSNNNNGAFDFSEWEQAINKYSEIRIQKYKTKHFIVKKFKK